MWSLLALLTKTVLNFLTSFLSPHAFWIHCASFCSFKSTTTSSLATWSFMSCRPETLSRGTTMATLTHLLKFISFQGEGESKGVETASTPGLSSSGQEKEGQCRINGSQSEKCCSCASVAVVIKGLSQPLLEREFECYTCIDIPNLKRQQLCKNSNRISIHFKIQFILACHDIFQCAAHGLSLVQFHSTYCTGPSDGLCSSGGSMWYGLLVTELISPLPLLNDINIM